MKSWAFRQRTAKRWSLDLGNSDGTVSVARLQFFQANILLLPLLTPAGGERKRHNPSMLGLNSRAIVMDKVRELQDCSGGKTSRSR